MKKYFFHLGIVFLLWETFSSCTTELKEGWDCMIFKTDDPSFSSARLFYTPFSSTTPIQLEINYTDSGIRIYVVLLFYLAKPIDDESQIAEILITFENEAPFVIAGEILEGGQKIYLSENISTLIMSELKEGKSFSLKLGKESAQIEAKGFLEACSLIPF